MPPGIDHPSGALEGPPRAPKRAIRSPMPSPTRPLGLAYWIEPGQLLAGAYPGHALAEVADRQLGALLHAGVGRILDLMEEDPRGAPPYADRLNALAVSRGLRVEIERTPIEDHGVPDPAALARLERWLDGQVGSPVVGYVHCWGGRGRTGLVAGMHLVRHRGLTAAELPDAIAALRAGLPGTAPESDEQHDFLRSYAAATSRPA